MEPTQVTCTRVEQEDLDARYLAGTLSEEEAEAFEEHYFACDRCWSMVQLGLSVRAAIEETARESQPRAPAMTRTAQGTSARLTRRAGWPLALAASIAILAIGVWQRGNRPGVVPIDDGLRGPADSILVVASLRSGTLIASWSPKANADRYGVRLQKNDATLIVERMITDTSVAIPRDSLSGVATGERVYWEVRALDALGRTIARSRLTPTVVPAGRQ